MQQSFSQCMCAVLYGSGSIRSRFEWSAILSKRVSNKLQTDGLRNFSLEKRPPEPISHSLTICCVIVKCPIILRLFMLNSPAVRVTDRGRMDDLRHWISEPDMYKSKWWINSMNERFKLGREMRSSGQRISVEEWHACSKWENDVISYLSSAAAMRPKHTLSRWPRLGLMFASASGGCRRVASKVSVCSSNILVYASPLLDLFQQYSSCHCVSSKRSNFGYFLSKFSNPPASEQDQLAFSPNTQAYSNYWNI